MVKRGKANRSGVLLTVSWENGNVILIDQTKLPNNLVYVTCKTYLDVAQAIKKLVVRGAPAIGVAAAMGLALAAVKSNADSLEKFGSEVENAFNILRATRPTAVNLFWALERAVTKVRTASSMDEARKAIVMRLF